MTLNLASILRESALEAPSRPALIFGREVVDYATLEREARQLAAAFRRLGVLRGEPIAIMLPNTPEFVVSYFAAHYLGCPLLPLNVLLKGDEVAYHLNDSGAAALVFGRAFADAALAGVARAPRCRYHACAGAGANETALPERVHEFRSLLDGQSPVETYVDTMPDDTAVILYTSGTTGRPKGAELTHFNLFHNAEFVCRDMLPMTRESVSLAALPLFHSFGQSVIMNATLRAGGAMVIMPRFDAARAFELMRDHRVELFAGVPAMYFALLQQEGVSGKELSHLKYCCSGGAPMPLEVMRAFEEKFGVAILEGYGLSETSPVASFNLLSRPRKAGSIGLPIRGVEFKLVDDAGHTIDDVKQPGEICIRGPNVMKGYHRRVEDTERCLRAGWFSTGDIAYRDEDGYYFIVDRKKDMIIRAGFNVYPREVEEVLMAHPAVRDAAVVGVSHPSLGEEVKAVVVLKSGSSSSAEEIVAHCRARLAAFKYPRLVEFREALPRTATGKVLKRELRNEPGQQPNPSEPKEAVATA